MWNKCKAILLPTKDKAPICLEFNKLVTDRVKIINCTQSFQHLYIISCDRIKEGDWRMMADKTSKLYGQFEKHLGKHECNGQWKKIIATTDNELGFGDGTGYFEHLPQIPQQFIEHYVTEYNKSNIISDVLVEYGRSCGNNCSTLCGECQPERFKLKTNPNNTINIKAVKDSFSRDEVEILLFNLAEHYGMTSTKSEIEDFNTWIEQNL